MSIAVPAIGTPYIHASVKRRKNTWFTIKDGNWTDTSIWISNERKRWAYPGINIPVPVLPQIGDDVYIGHTVAYNITGVNTTVNNLYISGTLTSAANTTILLVNGDLQCSGTISFTGNVNLTLMGVNNYINSFSSGSSSTVTYGRIGNQYIMDLSYANIATTGLNTKFASNNLTPTGSMSIASGTILDLVTYNLQVGTTSTVSGTLIKSTSGTILFVGLLSSTGGILNFSGNPTVEFRAGWFINTPATNVITGTGGWSNTTNNQSATWGGSSVGAPHIMNSPWNIVGPITVSNGGGGVVQINSTIDGTVSGSTLFNTVNATILFNNTNLVMATAGVFDRTGSGNVIGYVYNGSATLPYTTYIGLIIAGTGTKTLAGNLSLSGTLTVGISLSVLSILEVSTFDLSVTGATTINGISILRKSSAGAVTFIGLLTTGNSSTLSIDFSGNPTVEVRGGITLANPISTVINSGSSLWSFTNNQSILPLSSGSGSNISVVFDCPILISGANTLTVGSLGTFAPAIFKGTIDGNNVSSTLDSRGIIYYQNATKPMATSGLVIANAATNTFSYNLAGTQDVLGQTYSTLEFGGSGAKKLLANAISTNFTISGTSTINYNGFTLNTTNIIYSSLSAETILSNASLLATNLILRGNSAKTLAASMSFTNITMDTTDLTITFSGFTITSTGLTSYTANSAQKVWGTSNFIVNNLTLGTSGVKTLQGNVSVPGTYILSGTATKNNNGFIFGNP